MEKVLETLEGCPLFAGLTRQELAAALDCVGGKAAAYEKGEVVLREGDEANRLGVVLRGRMQAEMVDHHGDRSLLGAMEAGELFGETFACAGVERLPVSVVCAEAGEALLLDSARILHPCDRGCAFHQRIVYNLMRVLAEKNLRMHEKLRIAAQKTTREKLLAYLNAQSKKQDSRAVVLPYDRQELADFLMVDRSGLSAEIGKLRKEGILECRKNRFVLK